MTTRAPYSRLSHSGTAPDTTLASGVDNAALTVTVTDGTGWPDGSGGDFIVTFEPGSSNEEKAVASARSGNSITLVQRGFEGAAAAHTASTVIRHSLSATEVDESNYAVTQTVGAVTAKGDMLYASGANALTRVAKGSAGQSPVYQSDGTVAAGNPTPASHTHAETDVDSLVTDLGNKLDAPVTAIAVGSILAGTGAGVVDSVAVGADGTVLTADSTATAGVSWKTPTIGMLAYTDDTTSTSTISNSVATTALDSTNATLTFTAPSSGKVLLRISGQVNVANNPTQFGWVTHGTTTVVGRLQQTTPTGSFRSTWEQVVTGLTAGQSYHLDLACKNSNLATQTQFLEVFLSAWAV